MADEPERAEKPLAYSYVRMSTKEQLQGDSLRRQTQLSQKYAEEHGLHLVADDRLKEDVGLSAFTGENLEKGALGTFIQRIEEGTIPKGSYLLVEAIDRISRQNIKEAVPLFLKILNAGVKVVTLSDGRVFDSADKDQYQLLWSFQLMVMAHEESKRKGERVGAAWAQKRKFIQSEKLTKKCPAWLELSKDRKSFKLDQTKANIVSKIFSMASSGYGTYAITRQLNQEGVQTLTGAKAWAKSSIEKLLLSRAVLGEFQPHRKPRGAKDRIVDGPPIKDYYPRIIEDELFDLVQSQRSLRKIEGSGRRGNNVANLFSQKAKCYYCGAPIQMVNKGYGAKGGRYLRCSGAMKASGCNAGSWRYNDFEKSFFYFLRNEINLGSVIDAATILQQNRTSQQKISTLKAEIAALEQNRQSRLGVLDQFTQSGQSVAAATISFIANAIDEVTNKIEQKKVDLSTFEKSVNGSKESAEKVEVSAENISDKIFKDLERADEASRSRLRSEIANMVSVLKLAPDGLEIENRFLRKGSMASYLVSQALGEQSDAGLHYATKVFEVELVDGTSKSIGVDENDPLQFGFQIDGYAEKLEAKTLDEDDLDQETVPIEDDQLTADDIEVIKKAMVKSRTVGSFTGEFKRRK